ncbi:MAG: bifunctional oligoribonuclease/PAP phosphatase NrnA [Candidatus Parcubacteria bacterium]|nr:bifunctional oligoribonuclease/PAP phosphatase NrnA [Candidatus Parcubacteria bacterium]
MTVQTKSILNAIIEAKNPLIICHEKPDGDTLGASLALSRFLANTQKVHKHFCVDKPANYFSYLPKIENLITDLALLNIIDHDLIITVDCGAIERTGIFEEIKKYNITLINIDHHQSNNNFGHLNLVVPQASSTSEILYDFFQAHQIEIDKYMATNLLTGIITDTMNFTNAATTNDSLKIASELLNLGARINQIISSISQNKNIDALKLWGKILYRLEHNPEYNFAFTAIAKKDLEECQITSPESLDGMANFLSLIQDVNFIIVMTEEDNNQIKVSLRTVRDEIDMAEIAQKMGGGGHRKAAGFKIDITALSADTDWKNFIINAIITKLKKSEV